MKGSQQLLFFYLKSHAYFVPFIFVLFPLDFSPLFMAYIRVTAQFSTTASSQNTSNVSGVKAQEHMASKAEGITTPHAARESYLGLQRHGGISVHDQNTAMRGYTHFRKDRREEIMLCVKKWLEKY